MKKICEVCKTPYKGRARQRFCSRACLLSFWASKALPHKTCALPNCDNTFETRDYPSRKAQVYCSTRCRTVASRRVKTAEPVTLVCQSCHREFVVRNAHSYRKHCSKKCRDKTYPRIKKVCKTCGQEFTVLYMHRQRTYCCYECFAVTIRNPNRHPNRIPYYGPNWRQQRELARKRDDCTCQACGKAPYDLSDLQCHHIVHFDVFGIERYKEANQLSNLVTLCRSCHRHVHNNTIPCPMPVLYLLVA